MTKSIQYPVVQPELVIDRRTGRDRRKKQFHPFRRPFFTGRRRMLRRESDRRRFFLFDYYDAQIFYSVVLTLMLSIADALLTLWLIEDGAKELNPVMAYFLTLGPYIFMMVKYVLTSLSVLIVVLLSHMYIQGVQLHLSTLLYCFAACFSAVVVWELFLILRFII